MNQATGDVTVSATDDGSGYVKLDDGGVKQVVNPLGLASAMAPMKTSRSVRMAASRCSTVQSLGSAGGYNAFSAGYGNSTTDAFVVRGNGTIVGNDAGAATTGNYKYKLDSNGSAIFTSEVTSGSAYNIGDGTVLYPQGLLGIRKDGLEAGVIQVLNGGSTTDETVSIANTAALAGLNANWAGAFFGIRKALITGRNISIDSASTAPSGFLVSVGVDNPTGGTALLCQKGVPNLGGSVSAISSKLIGTAMRFSAPLFKPAELKLATQQLESAAMHLQPRLQVSGQLLANQYNTTIDHREMQLLLTPEFFSNADKVFGC